MRLCPFVFEKLVFQCKVTYNAVFFFHCIFGLALILSGSRACPWLNPANTLNIFDGFYFLIWLPVVLELELPKNDLNYFPFKFARSNYSFCTFLLIFLGNFYWARGHLPPPQFAFFWGLRSLPPKPRAPIIFFFGKIRGPYKKNRIFKVCAGFYDCKFLLDGLSHFFFCHFNNLCFFFKKTLCLFILNLGWYQTLFFWNFLGFSSISGNLWFLPLVASNGFVFARRANFYI